MSRKFDTKIAVVVRDDLATWQKLNVVAFTVSGIAATGEDAVGEPYKDASGNMYMPMLKQPVMVFAADADQIRWVYDRAREHDTKLSIFTEELFLTGNDEDNRAAVRAVEDCALNLVGLALCDKKKTIDNVLKGLHLHA